MKLKYTAISIIVILMLLLCSCKHVSPKNNSFFARKSQTSTVSQEISKSVSEESAEISYEASPKPDPNIEFYNDGQTVKAIYGEWSENTVLDFDEAFASINEIKDLLKIKDVNKELAISVSYSMGDKMLYVFDKLYNNIRVYGSEVIISVRYENPVPNYLESYLIPDEILQKTDFSENFSEEDIIEKYNAKNVRKYIYAYDKYMDKPVIVYTADIDGETKIINAVSGEFIELQEGDE